MVFDEETLVDRPNMLTPVASCPIPIVEVDMHTVTFQRFNKSVERVARQRVAGKSQSHERKDPGTPTNVDDSSYLFDLPASHCSHHVTSHDFALEEKGTCSASVKSNYFTTPLYGV